jgi:amino acid adenylation domain-containing protein
MTSDWPDPPFPVDGFSRRRGRELQRVPVAVDHARVGVLDGHWGFAAVFAAFVRRHAGAGPWQIAIVTEASRRAILCDPAETASLCDLAAALAAAPSRDGDAALGVALGTAPAPAGSVLVWRAEPCMLEYDADVFDPRMAARIAARLAMFASAAAADPTQPLGALPVVPEAERDELLAIGTGPGLRVAHATAIDDVDRHARARSTAIAVDAGGRTITWGELRRTADRLARRLRSRGIGRGSFVGVAVDRSVELVASLLAVCRLGAAYVPLDPCHPPARLASAIERCGSSVVIADRGAAHRLAGLPIEVILVGDDRDRGGDDVVLATEARAEDTAYVIFTSGSTAEPKGVEVAYGALRNLVVSKATTIGMTVEDTQLAVMSVAFDASLFELVLPIYTGGRLAIASRDEMTSGELLARRLAASRATVMGATPATWRGLLAAGWVDGHPRTMMVGGEALAADLARRLRPKGRVFNMYGLTETAITSLAYEIVDRLPTSGATAPIGRPLHNIRARVVDDRDQLVPIGVAGELLVSGSGLARGYLGQPGLTRERFVGAGADRSYRTGDLVRIRHDGQLEFLGRRDDQVKVHGVRIELAEVEAAVAALPSITSAAVIAHGEGEATRLVAFVVGDLPATLELRRRLRERLPDPMIPTAFVPIAALPLTPNGKVDRRALALRIASSGPGRGVPANDAESVLATALCELLGLAEVSIDTHLPALGLDSITGVRVLHRLTERGYELKLTELFADRSIAALAGAMRAAPVDPRAREPREPQEYPATNNQKHPCLVSLSNPGTGVWNCQIACTLTGPFEPAFMTKAWQRVLERHDALRSGFRWRAGTAGLFQIVERTVDVPVRIVDLTRVSRTRYPERLAELQDQEIATAFDVQRAPLWQVAVVRAPDGGHELMWTYHSSIIDGWSSAIVMREVFACYEAEASGVSPTLPPAVPYRSHVDRMARIDPTPAGEYFARDLAGYEFGKLLAKTAPGGRDDGRTLALPPATRAFLAATGEQPFFTAGVGAAMVTLPSRAPLDRFCGRNRLAIHTVMQAAWALVVMREHETPDALIGMVAANRFDFTSAVGKYTNMLPIRIRVREDDLLVPWLAAHEQHVLDALQYETAPPAAWVARIGLPPGQFPFETTLTYVNYGVPGDEVALASGLRVGNSRQLDRGVPPSLGMVIIPGDAFRLRLEYNRSSGFDDGRIERLLAHFVAVLGLVVDSDVQRPVMSLLHAAIDTPGSGVPIGFITTRSR